MTTMLTTDQSLSRRDIVVTDGDLQLVSGNDEKIQRLDLRLLSFVGDFFIDLTDGIPYWGGVFGRGVNEADLYGIYSDAITNVDGIQAVVELNIRVEASTRQLFVSGTCYLDDGTLSAFSVEDSVT